MRDFTPSSYILATSWLGLFLLFTPIAFAQNQPPSATTEDISALQNQIDAITQLNLDDRLKKVAEDASKVSNTVSALNDQLNTTISNLEKRLKNEEDNTKKLSDLVDSTKLNAGLSELRTLRSSIADSALAISNAKFDIASHTLTILAFVFGVLAPAAAVAGYVFRRTILDDLAKNSDEILKKAEQRVTDLIGEHINTAKDITIASIHSRFAYTYYTHYAEDFDKLRIRQFPHGFRASINFVAREAGMARHLTDSGLAIINRLQVKMVNDTQWRRVKAELVNQKLYNITVELLCRRSAGENLNDNIVLSVLGLSDECLLIANEEPMRSSSLWPAMYESAAFAMISLGDAQNRLRGRKLIEEICAGNTPSRLHSPPTQEMIDRLKTMYNV